jgi:hypothetical protein
MSSPFVHGDSSCSAISKVGADFPRFWLFLPPSNNPTLHSPSTVRLFQAVEFGPIRPSESTCHLDLSIGTLVVALLAKLTLILPDSDCFYRLWTSPLSTLHLQSDHLGRWILDQYDELKSPVISIYLWWFRLLWYRQSRHWFSVSPIVFIPLEYHHSPLSTTVRTTLREDSRPGWHPDSASHPHLSLAPLGVEQCATMFQIPGVRNSAIRPKFRISTQPPPQPPPSTSVRTSRNVDSRRTLPF